MALAKSVNEQGIVLLIRHPSNAKLSQASLIAWTLENDGCSLGLQIMQCAGLYQFQHIFCHAAEEFPDLAFSKLAFVRPEAEGRTFTLAFAVIKKYVAFGKLTSSHSQMSAFWFCLCI